jgi:hypothetical protein
MRSPQLSISILSIAGTPHETGTGKMSETQSSPPRTRRLLSPAGFVLVILCFLFPFIAVSCQSPVGSVSVEYSGNDLAFGGQPSISTSDGDVPQESGVPPATPQPLALLAYLLTIAGLFTALISSVRARLRTTAIIASAAALFVIINETSVYNRIVSQLAGQSSSRFDSDLGGLPIDAVSNLVHTQAGFWLTMLLLLAITALNVVELVRARAAPDAPGPPEPG